MNFYIGICEDHNTDPLKMGRIKVRVFDVHTDNRNTEEDHKILSTEDLPWAIPAYPVNTQTIDGLCDFQVPKKGSVILCSFLDADFQRIIYFGTVPKIALEMPDWTKGFSDPDKKHPDPDYLDESPISRLARNQKIDQTIIKKKRDTVKNGVICADNSWDEPPTQYNTEYPENRVIETRSGHFIELDDTDGAERIHIYHRKDTSLECHPNGDRVDRINNSKYTIILTDDDIKIEGNQNVHISIDRNETIENDENQHILNDRNEDIGRDENKITGHDRIETCGNDIHETAGRNIYISAGSHVKITAPLITLN